MDNEIQRKFDELEKYFKIELAKIQLENKVKISYLENKIDGLQKIINSN